METDEKRAEAGSGNTDACDPGIFGEKTARCAEGIFSCRDKDHEIRIYVF